MRISSIRRTLSRDTAEASAWSAELVRERLIEAFEIDRRLPRVGPARTKGWLMQTLDSFADRVAQGELASEYVLEAWAYGSVTASEITRMEEAFGWPRRYLVNGHAVEAKCLLAATFCIAYRRPIGAMIRQRGWSRSSFYRYVDAGAAAVAEALNRDRVCPG